MAWSNTHKQWRMELRKEELEKNKKIDLLERNRDELDKRAAYRINQEKIDAENERKAIEQAKEQERNRKEAIRLKLEQEERLAFEAERVKCEQLRLMKQRQMLRETSSELRELEAKLKCAYVTKELACQIAEKKAAQLESQLTEKRFQEAQRAQWEREQKKEMLRHEEEIKMKQKYAEALLEQIAYTIEAKKAAIEEFLKEKIILDEIVRQIQEEDERELEIKMRKMLKTKKDLDNFRREKEILKNKERLANEDENRRIMEYLNEQTLKEEARAKEIEETKKKKEQLSERLGKQINKLEIQKREREEAALALLEAEAQRKLELKLRAEIEVQLRNRIQRRIEFQQQYEEKVARLRKEHLAAEEERQKILLHHAEQERNEQLLKQQKIEEVIRYRRNLETILEERKAAREAEIKQLLENREADFREEQNRLKMIEEERIRLLKEHTSRLIGFLPPGVLREDDLPHLGSEILEKYREHEKLIRSTQS